MVATKVPTRKGPRLGDDGKYLSNNAPLTLVRKLVSVLETSWSTWVPG